MFTVIIRSTSHRTDEDPDKRHWVGAWVRAITRAQHTPTAEELQPIADGINAWPPDAQCNPKLANFCSHYEARVVPFDEVSWGRQPSFGMRALLTDKGVIRHVHADSMSETDLREEESRGRTVALHYARQV